MTSIYIHFPFCKRKCYYCDFYSITDLLFEDNYTEHLLKEIDLRFGQVPPGEISTIYFGGGTPSLFNITNIEKIKHKLAEYIDLNAVKEWTVEVNPGTIDFGKLKSYLKLGINRISIGIQSFNENELRFLQRIHSVSQAVESVKMAKEAGFDNISIDLIFSIPGQTISEFGKTLDKAIELDVKHISAYSLIVEEKTLLFEDVNTGKIEVFSEKADADMYEYLMSRLKNEGFIQYEVSNFCKSEEFKSFHNLNYWHCGNYYAFGPSANGYLNNERYKNISDLAKYCEMLDNVKMPEDFRENLSNNDKINEMIILALRSDGLDLNKFRELFKFDFMEYFKDKTTDYIQRNLMETENGILSLTPAGYLLCDEITVELMI